MPHLARDRDFGIRHDPEADRTAQVKKIIDFAEHEDGDEPPRQRARPNHDARLMKWFRAVEKELKTLKEENDAFGSRDYISAKACGDYLTRLYKCIQVNEWIKTIEEISQYCVTTPLFEQRIRSLAATTGEALPKDPHGTAEDIVVAFNFVINTLGINPVNYARTFVRRGAGSSGVRTAAPTV